MIIENFNHALPSRLAGWVSLNISDSIKENHMLIIKLLDVHKERFVPDVRLRNNVVPSNVQFSSVGMVSVLDMGGKPVLGPLNSLWRNRDGSSLELGLEVVVLEVVAMAIIILNFAELLLLIIKVHPELALAVGKDLSISRSLSHSPDAVEQYLVFIIKPLIKDHEALIPDIGLRGLMHQLPSVGKVSVLDVLHQPVLSIVDEVTVQGH